MAELTEPIDVEGELRWTNTFECQCLDVAGDWLACAMRLPGKSLHLAVGLLLIANVQNSRKLALSNRTSRHFGLDRNSKYRALAWLEEARLVTVERKLGRSPIVTILDLGGPA